MSLPVEGPVYSWKDLKKAIIIIVPLAFAFIYFGVIPAEKRREKAKITTVKKIEGNIKNIELRQGSIITFKDGRVVNYPSHPAYLSKGCWKLHINKFNIIYKAEKSTACKK